MFTIEENKIYLTRGDTAEIQVKLEKLDGTIYRTQQGDAVYFRMKRYPTNNTSEILIEKTAAIVPDIEEDDITVSLVPADTINLDFGEYSYEIELVTEAEEHYTVIADTEFVIGKEIENHEQ